VSRRARRAPPFADGAPVPTTGAATRASVLRIKLADACAEGDRASTTGAGHVNGSTMRWSRTTVLSLALVGALAAPVAAAQLSGQFRDVDPRSPHAEAVDWLAANGITRGCAPELFCGDDAVSRAQLASFLQRLATAGVVDAATVDGFTADELRGRQGEPGLQGPQGIQGEPGETGATGATGEDGRTIYGLDGAPDQELGRLGDLYLDTASISLYGPKRAQGWGEGVSLIGRDGLDGEDGRDGENGQDGAPGAEGAQGVEGPQGEAGPEGPAGPQGETGPEGPAGPQGEVGPTGPQGPEGTAGRDGIDGFGTPISAAMDHGQEVVLATQGQLQLVASCSTSGDSQRLELAFTGSEDGWYSSANWSGGELTAGQRAVSSEVSAWGSPGPPTYQQTIDRGHAMAPDGSYLAYQQETTVLALNVFGRDCVVAGVAFGQHVDLTTD
jgi:hypothetical protein